MGGTNGGTFVNIAWAAGQAMTQEELIRHALTEGDDRETQPEYQLAKETRGG
jgi:hypothetical protein